MLAQAPFHPMISKRNSNDHKQVKVLRSTARPSHENGDMAAIQSWHPAAMIGHKVPILIMSSNTWQSGLGGEARKS